MTAPGTLIHSTALIDPAAELDTSVQVGPYAVIGAQVRIGAGTTIGAHCVIEGRTCIGRDNRIFQFASLGAVPQDKKSRASRPSSSSATATPSASFDLQPRHGAGSRRDHGGR
jgi:Acyl-[acyl carrier protein]--UDP-N-acetylglucosamine O-acyltransferase